MPTHSALCSTTETLNDATSFEKNIGHANIHHKTNNNNIRMTINHTIGTYNTYSNSQY